MKKLIFIICVISLFSCKENKNNKEAKQAVNKNTLVKVNKDSLVTSQDTLKVFFNLDIKRMLGDYKDNISKAKEVLKSKNTLDNIAVESVIPINLEEFMFFYKLTYSTEEDWDFFERINTLIIQKSQSDAGNCIERYSNLAEFVDGEYAEGFYGDILIIAKRNSNKFCNIFINLSAISKKNLLDVYNEVCKGIKQKDD